MILNDVEIMSKQNHSDPKCAIIVSASRSHPGLVSCSWYFLMHFNYFGAPVGVHFATLGVTVGAFWGHFCTLWVIFGTLWVYFLCSKTDWGTKGASRGASTKIKSPFWVQFGCYFWNYLCFLGQHPESLRKDLEIHVFLDRVKPRKLSPRPSESTICKF